MNKFSRLLQVCRIMPAFIMLFVLSYDAQAKAYFYEETVCQEGKTINASVDGTLTVLSKGSSSSNPNDCCKGSKPKSITLKFTGKGCSATNTSQKPGKYSCADFFGGPGNLSSVYIVAAEKSNGSKKFFEGTVALNGSFTISASSKFGANTWFLIYTKKGGILRQRVQIHTSCSAPIILGDQFGSLVLENVVFKNGSSCLPPPPPPPPTDICPIPEIEISNGQICKGEPVVYKAKDLGIPCAEYTWDFGQGATPQKATGIGPHTVSYSADGQATVSLNVNNNCPGGTGNSLCPDTTPGGGGKVDCFKIDPPKNGSKNGVNYTVIKQSGEYKFLTVTGSNIVSVNVKGGPGSITYTNPPFVNLTAPINPNNGKTYGISHFTICVQGSGSGSGGDDCCKDKKKPNGLTLRYTGTGCSASNTSQSPGKYSCSDNGGGPNNAPSVYIVAAENSNGSGTKYFSGNVTLGSNFTIKAPSGTLKANTYFLIYNQLGGSLLQRVQIHTSCSVPIVPGDQFGSLKLLNSLYQDGSICGDDGPQSCFDCDKTTTLDIDIDKCDDLAELGDFVWLDENGNGIQDDNEKGIPGVTVILKNCADQVLNATFTDADGKYLFKDLQAGFYKVTFINPKPGELVPSPLNAGTDDEKDSDADINGNTACIELDEGESNLTIDAGFTPAAPPCNINPQATNITCLDNGTPTPIDDLFTFVLTVTGTNTGPAWTAQLLGGTIGGAYNTPVVLGPYPISGGPIQINFTDVLSPNCQSNLIVVPPAPCSQSPLGKIGDFVWYDVNGNGLQDNNEVGIPGVSVILENCGGVFLQDTQTGPDGKYCFENLQPGSYRVRFVNPGSFLGNSLAFTTQNVGNNDEIDSDADANGTTACIVLGSGETNLTIDAGLKPVPCDNVTYPGKIGSQEFKCGPYVPTELVGTIPPSGGTGQLEYQWLQSTTGCPNNLSQAIPGANGPNYQPGQISQTTWYVRLVRRAGCTQWLESNCVKKEVQNCEPTCNATITTSPGTITVQNPGNPPVAIQVFDANTFAPIFSCSDNCSNPQVIGGLAAGAYFVKVNVSWTPFCEISETVVVPVGFSGGGSSNLLISQGNGVNINSAEGLLGLEVYPNPAKDFALVRWDSKAEWQQATLTVLNQLGQQVQLVNLGEVATGNYQLDLSNLNDGQYFIHFRADGQMPAVKKLIVKR